MQTYEYRHWAFSTSVCKNAFSVLIHVSCPTMRTHWQRTAPLGRTRAGDPEQLHTDYSLASSMLPWNT